MIKAFFSTEAYSSFDNASRTPLSVEKAQEQMVNFEKVSAEATVKLAKELGII